MNDSEHWWRWIDWPSDDCDGWYECRICGAIANQQQVNEIKQQIADEKESHHDDTDSEW